VLTKNCLLNLTSALESAQAELQELIHEKEWYVTSVTDQLASALEICYRELNTLREEDIIYHGTKSDNKISID
jgi:hypothetical protein